ncbi:MAG: hypothetical protein NT131_08520 [Methanomassiliicoccales archaeon]|nr:hypothetical protein [Methanomassiliicoccales archaeon]
MKYDSGKFEGGYRLEHIHKTKRLLFLAQAAITIVFAIYLLLVASGFTILPFFLSINAFLYFVLIMLLLINIEGFFFIILEMRFVKSISTKFIITQRGFRSSVVWAIVALLVVLVFWTSAVPAMAADAMQESGTVVAGEGVPAILTTANSDIFGVMELNTLDFVAHGEAQVFILSEHNYDMFKNSGEDVLGSYRINTDNYYADPELTVDFPDYAHGEFYILIYSESGHQIDVDYTYTKNVSESMMTYLPLMSMLFLIAHSAWAIYMLAINKRYVTGGIYR